MKVDLRPADPESLGRMLPGIAEAVRREDSPADIEAADSGIADSRIADSRISGIDALAVIGWKDADEDAGQVVERIRHRLRETADRIKSSKSAVDPATLGVAVALFKAAQKELGDKQRRGELIRKRAESRRKADPRSSNDPGSSDDPLAGILPVRDPLAGILPVQPVPAPAVVGDHATQTSHPSPPTPPPIPGGSPEPPAAEPPAGEPRAAEPPVVTPPVVDRPAAESPTFNQAAPVVTDPRRRRRRRRSGPGPIVIAVLLLLTIAGVVLAYFRFINPDAISVTIGDSGVNIGPRRRPSNDSADPPRAGSPAPVLADPTRADPTRADPTRADPVLADPSRRRRSGPGDSIMGDLVPGGPSQTIDRSATDSDPSMTSSIPDTSIPDTSMSDTSMTDTSIPDMAMSDTSIPDMAMTDTSTPDMAMSNSGATGGEPAGDPGDSAIELQRVRRAIREMNFDDMKSIAESVRDRITTPESSATAETLYRIADLSSFYRGGIRRGLAEVRSGNTLMVVPEVSVVITETGEDWIGIQFDRKPRRYTIDELPPPLADRLAETNIPEGKVRRIAAAVYHVTAPTATDEVRQTEINYLRWLDEDIDGVATKAIAAELEQIFGD